MESNKTKETDGCVMKRKVRDSGVNPIQDSDEMGQMDSANRSTYGSTTSLTGELSDASRMEDNRESVTLMESVKTQGSGRETSIHPEGGDGRVAGISSRRRTCREDFERNLKSDDSYKSAPFGGVSFKRRKPGRPPTTGMYCVQQEHEKQKQEVIKKEVLEQVLDSKIKAKDTKSSANMKQAHEFAAEFKQTPSQDIAAQVFESMESIRKVAEKSKNLKGDLKQALRKAANIAGGAMVEIEKRLSGSKVIEEIRNELKSLRYENEKLKNEIERLKKGGISMQMEPTHGISDGPGTELRAGEKPLSKSNSGNKIPSAPENAETRPAR